MDHKQSKTPSAIKRYKGVFVVAIEVLILAVAINAFFVPKILDIFALRGEIEQKIVTASETASYMTYLQSLEGSTIDIESDIVHYALPSENDVISLIITYEGLGARSGVELSPLDLSPGLISSPSSPGADTKKTQSSNKGKSSDVAEGIQSLSFDATAKIDNPDTAEAFIKDIYRARRLFDIKRMSWRTENDGTLTLDMTFLAYYYPEQFINPSEKLVRKGKQQEQFIQDLNNSVVYDEFILDNVRVGKQDLFEYEPGIGPQVTVEEVPDAAIDELTEQDQIEGIEELEEIIIEEYEVVAG